MTVLCCADLSNNLFDALWSQLSCRSSLAALPLVAGDILNSSSHVSNDITTVASVSLMSCYNFIPC